MLCRPSVIIRGNCIFVALNADASLLLLLTGITWIKKRRSVNGISVRFFCFCFWCFLVIWKHDVKNRHSFPAVSYQSPRRWERSRRVLCSVWAHRLPALTFTPARPFEVRCDLLSQQMWLCMVLVGKNTCQYKTKQCSFSMPQWCEHLWPGRCSVSLAPWTTAMDIFSPF